MKVAHLVLSPAWERFAADILAWAGHPVQIHATADLSTDTIVCVHINGAKGTLGLDVTLGVAIQPAPSLALDMRYLPHLFLPDSLALLALLARLSRGSREVHQGELEWHFPALELESKGFTAWQVVQSVEWSTEALALLTIIRTTGLHCGKLRLSSYPEYERGLGFDLEHSPRALWITLLMEEVTDLEVTEIRAGIDRHQEWDNSAYIAEPDEAYLLTYAVIEASRLDRATTMQTILKHVEDPASGRYPKQSQP